MPRRSIREFFEDNFDESESDFEYKDDYYVDIIRKRRTKIKNNGVSSHQELFAPEDLGLETPDYDGNPSLNKEASAKISGRKNNVADREYLLDKGKNAHLFDEDDDDDDYYPPYYIDEDEEL